MCLAGAALPVGLGWRLCWGHEVVVGARMGQDWVEPDLGLDLDLGLEEGATLAGFAPEEAGVWRELRVAGQAFPVLTGAFWTARQRQAANLHEVSYRACYKPQLPRLFIERLTGPGERVYDPFAGRGTTAVEAALLGRQVASNDINPLSRLLAEPRLTPPEAAAVAARLEQVPLVGADGVGGLRLPTPWGSKVLRCPRAPAPLDGEHRERSEQAIPPFIVGPDDLDLSMFFHPDTEAELRALRAWLLGRQARGEADGVDRWIRMVATNRLTGHSPGFFSVYTLPPNQAASADQQRVINRKRGQTPPYRCVRALVLKKTLQLLKGLSGPERAHLAAAAGSAQFLTGDARHTPELASGSVALTVTSPPFLDVVQYARDNWLRCWFNGLDAEAVAAGITMARKLADWNAVMGGVLAELFRVTRSGGHVAFEVGEVHRGTVRLEEAVLPLGLGAGFQCLGVLVNQQAFTKTAHIWGVDNNEVGTNSNRIVLFRKP